jgi:ABC-type lipoprotein export system ATPase subunit
MLRAVGLVKSYRAPTGKPIRVLAGVDLTVKGGELVVVSGPSGSGCSKTATAARSGSRTRA